MIGIDNESELLAEHQAAAQAIKDAEDAKRQAEYKARNDAEHALRVARITPHLTEIAKHMPFVHSPEVRDGKIFLGTFDTSYDFSFEEHYASTSSWRSIRTGKWKFVTGRAYGDRKTWLPLKAGGYNYKGIANELVECFEDRKRRDRAQSNKLTNEAIVAEVKQRMNLTRHDYKLSASADPAKPVFVKFEFSRSMTAEEAEALIKLLTPLNVFSFNKD